MTATACFTFDHLGDVAPFLDLLDRHGVRGTFFLQGEYGESDPDGVKEVVGRGHELGMHGWAHEEWSALAPDEEHALAFRATRALTRAARRAPVGFRAPAGARTASTGRLLADLGYHFDASLADDGSMQPSVLEGGVPSVPFVWAGVDGAYYLRPEPADPSEVRAAWLGALGRELFVSICHAEITGVDDARLAVLDDVMGAAARDESIRVLTVGQVAEEVTRAR
jgi:peptidoglycan/xylan/chitin deacetylase (PgdA/CDA1 family)